MVRSTVKVQPNAALARNWGWLLALGIVFIILGCVGFGMLAGLTLVSMLFFSALLFVAGLSQIVDVFKSKQWKGTLWHALIAILYIIGGAVVFYDPFLASSFITVLLAWLLIIIGITRITMGYTLRHSAGWAWLLFGGLCSIILGVLILMQWPWSGLWVIGMFIAIEMLVNGWSYVFIALALRSRQA